MHNLTSTGLFREAQPLDLSLRYIPYAIDVWCPVAQSRLLKRGQVTSTRLLGNQIVLFRGEDGQVRALQDRCPHRGVELSMGHVCGNAIQCAYHGWRIDGLGRPLSQNDGLQCTETLKTGSYPVVEASGLVWLFLGAGNHGETGVGQPPELDSLGGAASVDLLIELPIAAHWSLVLDNGVDLFHQHLHRDVPLFFRIDALDDYGAQGAAFVARYKAQISDELGRRRSGSIEITVDRNVAALRFADDLVIYGISTPRSGNGREVTMWWLLRKSTQGFRQIFVKCLLPLIRRQIVRGFQQDCRVLASEQRALESGFRNQKEVNPVILALHRHIERLVIEEAVAKGQEVLSEPGGRAALNKVGRTWLMSKVSQGDLAMIAWRGGSPAIVPPEDLATILPETDWIDAYRYGHFIILP